MVRIMQGKSPSLHAKKAGLGKNDRKKKQRLADNDRDNDSSSNSSSSDDEEFPLNMKTSNKKPTKDNAKQTGKSKQTKKQKAKEPASSSDDSDDDDSDDGSSSSDDDEKKDMKQVRDNDKKSSSDDDDDDDDSSDNDDDDDSSDNDDDDNEEETPKPFSDENAKWLKPKTSKKKGLLDSDDDDNGSDDNDKDDNHQENDSSDDDDDDDELLEVERQAQQLDQEMALEEQEAAEELQRTIREETAVYHLPTAEEWQVESEDRLVPPSELRSHMDSILEVLAEFQDRREPGRSRSEYIDWLAKFASELYGYIPELVQYFLTMFSPAECLEFLAASDQPRPLVVRTNTLKTRRKDLAAALMKRGVTLDPLARWSKVGLKIVESPVPIGATPEYLSGHYMLQSASSMCPILALNPQPNERVLDVSAAPGGKTSYIAQLMRNTGVVVANDLKAERQKATVANLHRLGVHNTLTCIHDGRQLGIKYPNRFDRILLDAPCSGLGVISRDPSVKVQRTIEDIKQNAHLQKELLLAAIDALKINKKGESGTMVYSTCSVSVYENEEVVNYALQKRDIKIVDTGLEFGKPGFVRYQQQRFHPSLALTRRFYPHVHNMDGFYVAKIIKLSDRKPEDTLEPAIVDEEEQAVENKKKKDDDHNKSKKKKKKGKKVLNKKRKADEDIIDANKPNKPKLSVPPPRSQPKEKKAKTNAKVTKPRRKRAATDS